MRQDAVSKALEIAPLLGEAYVALAEVHKDRAEYEEMETAYKKAIELSPNYADAYYGYATRQARLSRKQEAVDLGGHRALLDKAVERRQRNTQKHRGNRQGDHEFHDGQSVLSLHRYFQHSTLGKFNGRNVTHVCFPNTGRRPV